MLPIAASTTLADVSVLLGVGAADSKAASLANSQGPSTQGLPLGQLVSGQVLGFSGNNALVSISQQLYALQLPVDASVGDTLELQVLQTAPGLAFRLVNNPDVPPAAATEVSLSQGSTPAAPAAGQNEPNPATSPGAATLLAAPGSPASGGIGEAIATALQSQFEQQAGQASGPLIESAGLPAGIPVAVEGAPRGPASAISQAGSIASSAPSPAPGASPTLAATGTQALLAPDMARGSAAGPSQAMPPQTPAAALASLDATSGAHASSSVSPEAFRPNVTASTLSPAIWQGQVWPGQLAEVQIEPDRRRQAFEAPSLNAWRATLKLSLPQLGTINALVTWNTAGLRIDLAASDATSAVHLQEGTSDLLETLRSLDMRVQSIGVRHA
jgi:hypothetical protein